jgi:hypothetical protein
MKNRSTSDSGVAGILLFLIILSCGFVFVIAMIAKALVVLVQSVISVYQQSPTPALQLALVFEIIMVLVSCFLLLVTPWHTFAFWLVGVATVFWLALISLTKSLVQ